MHLKHIDCYIRISKVAQIFNVSKTQIESASSYLDEYNRTVVDDQDRWCDLAIIGTEYCVNYEGLRRIVEILGINPPQMIQLYDSYLVARKNAS